MTVKRAAQAAIQADAFRTCSTYNQAIASLEPYTKRLVHKACTCMLVGAPGLEALSKQSILFAKIKATSQHAA